jgi:hypothetical protein
LSCSTGNRKGCFEYAGVLAEPVGCAVSDDILTPIEMCSRSGIGSDPVARIDHDDEIPWRSRFHDGKYIYSDFVRRARASGSMTSPHLLPLAPTFAGQG